MEVVIDILKKNNSQIIELPKDFNLDCKKVKIIAKGNYLIIEPINEVRRGWDEAFKDMRKNCDDELLIDDVFEEDIDV
ncbi:MAG: AbrB/MazE/SpoVT family DNA-binding domain-containing protein [Epsilonproteobacteria bacterium]|nr:AbrB/MazE/SpoVT family DNA-binding domain-containing protein [Campylobacterota bacterium]